MNLRRSVVPAPIGAPAAAWRPGERVVIAAALVVQAALRALYVLHHAVDSDEPQHLHVIWGWTHGLVQYRDVFDNHAPLFHLLMTPWAAAFGERADVLVFMRWLMLPLVAVALIALHRIACALWNRVIAWRAVVVAGIVPDFLVTSGEFRADILWMAAWLGALAVMVSGRMSARRAFLAAGLLGVALATSLKTLLLLVALSLALVIVHVLSPRAPAERRAPGRVAGRLGAAAVGLGVVPAALLGWFNSVGALPALWYCTVRHNVVAGVGAWRHLPLRLAVLACTLAVVIGIARRMLRRPGTTFPGPRQVILLLTTVLGLALFETVWPLVTSEDFLPLTPLAALLVVVGVDGWLATRTRSSVTPRWIARAVPAAALALLLAGEVVDCDLREPALRNDTHDETNLLVSVKEETLPNEPVLDLKGETVFRVRPYYYVLEGLTKARLERGLLPDRIVQDVVESRTHFTVGDSQFWPPATRAYLNTHFVPAGPLRVLGSDLAGEPRAADGGELFDVAWPERFTILADGHPGHGLLDGLGYDLPRWLTPGRHKYLPGPGERRIIAVWSGAFQRARLRRALLRLFR